VRSASGDGQGNRSGEEDKLVTSPTGTRRYVCENCGQQERLPLAGRGCQVTCGDCGGPSYEVSIALELPCFSRGVQRNSDSSIVPGNEGNGRLLAEHDSVMQLHKCYRFRLEPTAQQEQAFRRFAGCRRWIWNWALERKRTAYQQNGKSPSAFDLMTELPRLKKVPETAFLKECSAQALQQTVRDLDRAFVNFFEKRSSYPKRKSRKRTRHAFRFPEDVAVGETKVRLPKIGLVKARLHRKMEGTIKSATVKQTATGYWFVTFVCHFEQAESVPTAHHPAGLDVGLETFATFDEGSAAPVLPQAGTETQTLPASGVSLPQRQSETNQSQEEAGNCSCQGPRPTAGLAAQVVAERGRLP
jgi:hypothetical protein